VYQKSYYRLIAQPISLEISMSQEPVLLKLPLMMNYLFQNLKMEDSLVNQKYLLGLAEKH